MSLQKKNVIQEFIKDDFVPSVNQFLVKYCTGRGAKPPRGYMCERKHDPCVNAQEVPADCLAEKE
ncbi:hypothetical protein Ocin01_12018 [Orchesella cincta]|uniref:Uncharacterized protein n=1 Tax=Orchesella cincta TaxID=48709 RepID=A0A1D2MP44_ORCCI|nr:hypothetical protein Ocin01_12018 [Orchesella cincta]